MDQCVIRISKELSDLQKKSTDLSLAVACRDIDVRHVKALVIGPHGTPYQFGYFEFTIYFHKEYPSKAPTVAAVTTNQGRCRFNPNIYANGKVCLSILGTWRGDRGEQWSSAQGMESTLWSIQSLMSVNPYENEPGFDTPSPNRSSKEMEQYSQKIQHETLRISVIQRLEEYLGISSNGTRVEPRYDDTGELEIPPEDIDDLRVPFEPFKDLCKRRFLWYYSSYVLTIEEGIKTTTAGEQFALMPFESKGNNMEGKFDYPNLMQRLANVKTALDEETESWAEEGLKSVSAETTVSVNLKHQFNQVLMCLKESDMPHVVSLENENPFVWELTYFGRPMTNFDSGLLRIKMNFSPRFPEEQPRVRLETKIFHHLVAEDGTICYTPKPSKIEDVMSHVEAIIGALEEDEPAYDPRKIVNPEANQLLFHGDKANKRMYHRRLRRSVQESTE